MSRAISRREIPGQLGALLLLAGAAAGPAKAAELDGELLTLCARYQVLEADYRRLCRASDGNTPAHVAAQAEFDSMSDEYDEVIDAIADLPARTPEGVRAKVEAVLAFHGSARDYGDGYPHKRLEWSLFLDVGGRV